MELSRTNGETHSNFSVLGMPGAFPRFAAVVIALSALSVLIGWAFDLPLLRSVLPGAVEMKANTAVGLLLDGVALFMLGGQPKPPARHFAQALSLAVTMLGIATLAQYAYGWQLGIDEALFWDTANAYNVHRGRMSPYTAGAFFAAGLALAALSSKRLRFVVWAGGTLVIAIGATSALGYLWNARELVTDRIVPPVALNTALLLMLLASGTLFAGRRAMELGRAPRSLFHR